MRIRLPRRRSEAMALAFLWAAAPFAALAQSPAPNCPKGYEKLCAALVKPPADSGIGSAGGTGSKSSANERSDVLENDDYEVKTPGSAQMK
jgi:hypothetical protein